LKPDNHENFFTMKVLKILLFSFIGLLSLIVVYAWYLGVFATITITEGTVGPYKLVCYEHFGPYEETGKYSDSLYQALKADGIETTLGFGIFYDEPGTKAESELHSIVGCILNEKDTARIAWMIAKGYRVEPMGVTKSAITEFPKKNKLSFLVGVMKVYPKFTEYWNEKGYQNVPAMEIYMPDKTIFSMEVK